MVVSMPLSEGLKRIQEVRPQAMNNLRLDRHPQRLIFGYATNPLVLTSAAGKRDVVDGAVVLVGHQRPGRARCCHDGRGVGVAEDRVEVRAMRRHDRAPEACVLQNLNI